MSLDCDKLAGSSSQAVPPDVSAAMPSLSELHEQTAMFAQEVGGDSNLIASVQRLQALSADNSASGIELSLPQMVAWLRSNPGLQLSLSFRKCG